MLESGARALLLGLLGWACWCSKVPLERSCWVKNAALCNAELHFTMLCFTLCKYRHGFALVYMCMYMRVCSCNISVHMHMHLLYICEGPSPKENPGSDGSETSKHCTPHISFRLFLTKVIRRTWPLHFWRRAGHARQKGFLDDLSAPILLLRLRRREW